MEIGIFCSFSAQVDILLEIDFIEEMRTTCGSKEGPQTFFQNSPYSQKFILIPLILQPCISQFCAITKGVLSISADGLGLAVHMFQ